MILYFYYTNYTSYIKFSGLSEFLAVGSGYRVRPENPSDRTVEIPNSTRRPIYRYIEFYIYYTKETIYLVLEFNINYKYYLDIVRKCYLYYYIIS